VTSVANLTVTAEATIDVVEVMGYAVNMVPEHSRSATAGRHKVTIHNTGNTALIAELLAETADDVTVELATTAATVMPGDTAKVDLRVIPPERFWSGPKRGYGFTIHAVTNDGVTQDFHGTFEQGPRLRSWFVPALVGAGIAMLLGTLAWFTLLKPYVDQTAENAAEMAILEDRAALRDRIAELELLAQEANELPLGEPADIRLSATAPPGGTSSESFAVSTDRVLSVTDVFFQNSTGAVGLVSLLRDGEVLLESELANFRDLDFHFVAPFQFDGGSTIEFRVACTAPGPSQIDCPAAATINGFVDQAR